MKVLGITYNTKDEFLKKMLGLYAELLVMGQKEMCKSPSMDETVDYLRNNCTRWEDIKKEVTILVSILQLSPNNVEQVMQSIASKVVVDGFIDADKVHELFVSLASSLCTVHQQNSIVDGKVGVLYSPPQDSSILIILNFVQSILDRLIQDACHAMDTESTTLPRCDYLKNHVIQNVSDLKTTLSLSDVPIDESKFDAIATKAITAINTDICNKDPIIESKNVLNVMKNIKTSVCSV
jgi:hypothetical protein